MARDPNEGIRRFLEDLRMGFDRRSWHERRVGERRARPQAIAADRRAQDDRRQNDRRLRRERRLRHFTEFTRREQAEILAMVTDETAEVTCPRCGGLLLLALASARWGNGTQIVQCTGCRGRLELSGVPRN